MSASYYLGGTIEREKGKFNKKEIKQIEDYFKKHHSDVKVTFPKNKDQIYFEGNVSIRSLDEDEHVEMTEEIRKLIGSCTVRATWTYLEDMPFNEYEIKEGQNTVN